MFRPKRTEQFKSTRKKIACRIGPAEAARLQMLEQQEAIREGRQMGNWWKSQAYVKEVKKEKENKEDKEVSPQAAGDPQAAWETLHPEGYRPGPPRNQQRKAQEDKEEEGPAPPDNEVEGKEVSRQAAGDEGDKRGVIRVVFAPPKQLRFGSARGIW